VHGSTRPVAPDPRAGRPVGRSPQPRQPSLGTFSATCTVLMLEEDAESGSLWCVADGDGDGKIVVYEFVGNHFEHAPATFATDEGFPNS
jgi:hypothetical protein